jgi:hypothetical protein
MAGTPGQTLRGLVLMHGVDGALVKVDEFLLKKNTKADLRFWETIREHLLDMI